MAKIFLPKDLPGKIAKLSPEAQKVAKRIVRAKIRRVRRAAQRGIPGVHASAQVIPIKRDSKPWDEMSPTEKKAEAARVRDEAKRAPYDPDDNSLEILASAWLGTDDQAREALSRELSNPTPEERAEEDRYWRENPDLFKPPK